MVFPMACAQCGEALGEVIAGTEAALCAKCRIAFGTPAPPAQSQAVGPVASVLARYLIYTLSVPERAVRSTVALAGGAAREAATFLVPRAFQSSKTYEIVVTNSLKFLTEQVGGAKSAAPARR